MHESAEVLRLVFLVRLDPEVKLDCHGNRAMHELVRPFEWKGKFAMV